MARWLHINIAKVEFYVGVGIPHFFLPTPLLLIKFGFHFMTRKLCVLIEEMIL